MEKRLNLKVSGLFLALALAACGPKPPPPVAPGAPIPPASAEKTGTLEWAVAGSWRDGVPTWKPRDPARHPAATLAFFGVKPTDTVVEIWPGGGYWTAILGPYLKEGYGRFIAAQVDPASSPGAAKQVEEYKAAFVAHPEIYGPIELTMAGKVGGSIAPDNTADVVLTFRNIHNWMSEGYADKVFADAYRALKPGGILGVEEHRLPSNKEQDPTGGSGYVKEVYVKQLAQAAGFEFVEASEINANKRDTADHPVWMLPPTMRKPAPGSPEAANYDPEVWKAIGESDRMTLKFRKPVAAAPAPAATASP